MTTRPNVLVIMSDEQNWDTLGSTGNPAARTPHLDALCGAGTRFDGAYTPFPLCCPSRTSLMTGLMPRHHHVLGNWRAIRPALASAGLGSWFADAGYHTQYVGKWHVPGTDPQRMGFVDHAAIPEVLDGKDRGRYIADYRAFVSGLGYELDPKHIENMTAADIATLKDPASPHRGTSSFPEEHYLETWQTGEWERVVDGAPDDRPWYGVVSYNAPHFPLLPPAPYDTIIDRDAIRLPDSWADGFDDRPAEVRRSHFAQKFTDLDAAGWVDCVAHYLGMVSLIDTQVGRIVAHLRRRGELDRTVIVFVSDHGDMMGAHRLMEKGHLLPYEEATRIPLIISHPDAAGGAQQSGLVSMVDLTATLLELAGIDRPAGIDGVGFGSAVGGGAFTGRPHVTTETVLWGHDSENAHGEHVDPAGFSLERDAINLSVRDHRHRYIWRSHDHHELYDHTVDPGERHDLAAERPDLVAGYRGLLADEVADTFAEVSAHLRRPVG